MPTPQPDAGSAAATRIARRLALIVSLLCVCAATNAGSASPAAGALFAGSVPYNVRAAHSGRCLDVTGGPGATANGAAIQQWDCLGPSQSNQMWTFMPTGDGSTYNVTALSSGKCLDVVGGPAGIANGVTVQDWDCFGYAQANQRWYFTRGDAVPVVPDLDGDAADLARDCNDGDPNVHPGAVDIAGDGIDEDCNGSDATAPGAEQSPSQGPTSNRQGTAVGKVEVLFVRVVNLWTLHGRGTRLRSVALRGAPRATRVTITCRGHGCPFARRDRRAANGHADLGRPFKHRLLAPGTVLDLHLRMPRVGRYTVRFQTRAGALPRRTDYCQRGRAAKLRRCG